MTGAQFKCLRSDRAKEFLTGWFDEWLDSMGAVHELSMAYTPQQNGIAERYNGTVSAVGRTLLIASSLPASFWPYAWVYAAYLRNRMTSNGSETPFQLFHGVKPDVFFLRVFGCRCYATLVDR